MKIRIAACQQDLHEPIAQSWIETIRSEKARFVSLPEHYPLSKDIHTLDEAARRFPERKKYLQELSELLQTTVVGGTLTETTPEGYYNTCYIFDNGNEIGFYRKVHPTHREQEAGVLRGEEFRVFQIREFRIGVLICADVLNASSFHQMSSLQCDLVFVPTASPFRPGESMEAKYERDTTIFLEGARILGCPLIKTCGVGTTFGHRIQGRSLIATPDRILVRAEPYQEDQPLLLLADLEVPTVGAHRMSPSK